VRLCSDQAVDGLTAAALYFDVFAGPESLPLDLLEQPAAAVAANLFPLNAGMALRCNLVRREPATSKYRITLKHERSRTRNVLPDGVAVKSEVSLTRPGWAARRHEFTLHSPMHFWGS